MPNPMSPPPPNTGRPIARPMVAGPTLQRGNYGIPPRQTTNSQPAFAPPSPIQPMSGPRMMDVAPPRPVQAPQPVQALPQQPSPQVQPAQPAPVFSQPVQPPLFSANRQAVGGNRATTQKPSGGLRRLAPKGKMILAAVGILFLLFGAGRLVTAGNLTGFTRGVGAVIKNDGSKTTIQFVADDGQLHRFTLNEGSREKIPGTAVQIAYQPGAADATVVQVTAVESAQRLGRIFLFIGILLSAAAATVFGLAWRKTRLNRPQKSQAVPVTA